MTCVPYCYQFCVHLHNFSSSFSALPQEGVTPLMVASGEGYKAIVEVFLKKESNIELQDEVGSQLYH